MIVRMVHRHTPTLLFPVYEYEWHDGEIHYGAARYLSMICVYPRSSESFYPYKMWVN